MATEFNGLDRVAMAYTNDQGAARYRVVTADNLAVMAGTEADSFTVIQLETKQKPRRAHCYTEADGITSRRTFVIPTKTHAANTPGTSLEADSLGKVWIVNSVSGEKTVTVT
jgi:hypothetical protein